MLRWILKRQLEKINPYLSRHVFERCDSMVAVMEADLRIATLLSAAGGTSFVIGTSTLIHGDPRWRLLGGMMVVAGIFVIAIGFYIGVKEVRIMIERLLTKLSQHAPVRIMHPYKIYGTLSSFQIGARVDQAAIVVQYEETKRRANPRFEDVVEHLVRQHAAARLAFNELFDFYRRWALVDDDQAAIYASAKKQLGLN